MTRSVQSVGARRAAAAALAASCLLAFSTMASAQVRLPATACDAALANPELHPQPEMPLENGTTAFSYTAGGAFVSSNGTSVTITLALTFQPGPDATIRLTALDDACAGGGLAGTVFTYTFGQLAMALNAVTYDAVAAEVRFNGNVQEASVLGTPRFLFVDVWDGELPSTHAAYSYLIDLHDPRNPASP